ncbi:MAG TPA: hypothetical protein VF062_23430 [Candidatus Limnocylindrales bacterium]
MTSTDKPASSSLRAWLDAHLTSEQRAELDELWDEWGRKPEPAESVDQILSRNWADTVSDYFGPTDADQTARAADARRWDRCQVEHIIQAVELAARDPNCMVSLAAGDADQLRAVLADAETSRRREWAAAWRAAAVWVHHNGWAQDWETRDRVADQLADQADAIEHGREIPPDWRAKIQTAEQARLLGQQLRKGKPSSFRPAVGNTTTKETQ